MAEKLVFDLLANDRASAGFAAAGRSASAAADDVLGLAKRLDEVGKKSAKAKVGLEGDKAADLQIDKLNLKLFKLGQLVLKPKISPEGFLKASIEIKAIELELDRLNKKAADISVSGGGLNLLEKSLGGLFGGGGSSGGGGGAAAGGLGAITDMLPVIAAGAAALGPLLAEAAGLVSGFAAAGAGIGAFALLALPTFKSIATAYTGISAAHAKYMDALAKEKQDPTKANAAATARALDALKVAQDNLSPSTKTAVGGIQSLMNEYHKLTTAFAPDALKVFDDGLTIANTLLPDIKPFADTAFTAIDGLLKKVGVFFASADFKKWLGTFEKIAGPAITAIGDGLGKVSVSAGKLLTIMSSRDVVHAINIAFDAINGILATTGYVIRRLMSNWDEMSAFIEARDARVRLNVAQMVRFFTVDVPTGFRLFRDEVGQVFNQVEADVLRMALSIDTTMGHLPGPLGAPFRAARPAIAAELAAIEGDVAATAARINADWRKIHGTANITVRADGTFRVGSTGLVARAAGGLITGGIPGRDSVLGALMPGELVVPVPMVNAGEVDHLRGRLPGFAAGGVVGSYSGAVPGLGPWMGREASAAQRALESATAKAFATAASSFVSGARFSGKFGPGVAQWGGDVIAALQQLGLSAGLTFKVLFQMQSESGGNPNAINLTDSNAAAGTPSKGLMQVIAPTFAAYAGPYRNRSIYDPMANIYAALNYGEHRYGPSLMNSSGQGIGSGHGYANGGVITEPILGIGQSGRRYSFGERGPETVTPGVAGGGNAYHITINVPPTANQAEIGRVTVAAIQQWEKRNGKGWRS